MQAVLSEAYGLVCRFYRSSIFCIFYNMTYGLCFNFILKPCSSKEISVSSVTHNWRMEEGVSQMNKKFLWLLEKQDYCATKQWTPSCKCECN